MDQFPPEAEGLGFYSNGTSTIGLVDGVNDASARLVEDFRVTRYELEVLARHYLEEVRFFEYDFAAYRVTGSTAIRMVPFGERRLGSIERILGEDVLVKALAPVEEEWRKRFDDLEIDLATPVKCEECGGEFRRENLCSALCQGCGGG
jgi:hypothetical protein